MQPKPPTPPFAVSATGTPQPAAAPKPGPGKAPGTAFEVRQLFPTPIALMRLPNYAAINAALEKAILAREAEVRSVQHSNLGGWQSPHDLASWTGEAGQAVLQTAVGLANRLTVDRAGRPIEAQWLMNAWANVNRAGHGNEFHTHPGAYWSATYYVRDGGCSENPALGGEFEIADPRGIAPAMLAPELAFATKNGLSVGVNESLSPVPGLMVMFPSWLSHGVRPYHGEDVRISIALNLTPKYKL
ncbi:MAG: TIGR02466 family protein [Pseudomonadota bacterium]